jgi:predicted Zn-dependent protease
MLPALACGDGLPDLGDVSQSVFSPAAERKLGEEIMREIRMDRAFLDDPEILDYLNSLGYRLASKSSDSKQAFEFFLIRDPTVNAFALPGGFIGVHTGLILTAESESELASVLGHEIGHVVQRHIARMIDSQDKTQMASLAALAVAILAARSNSQVSQALVAGSQAASIQSQLNFTRDNEREADRVGLQILEKAGFDVRAMPTFFERMQRATRLYEGNTPSYMRTHPVTTERIADIENRTQNMPYRQVHDSIEFQMLRARLRANLDSPREAMIFFEHSLAEKKFISEAATRYGLAIAAERSRDFARAARELEILTKLLPQSPIVDTFAAHLLRVSGQNRPALDYYRAALQRHPNYRALVYEFAELLLDERNPQQALSLIEQQQQVYPQDAHLYLLQAHTYSLLGKRLLQHQAQAEAYARQGNIGAAIDQLQIALAAGDGDFYQLSSAEARLRDLRRLNQDIKRKP